MKLALILVSAAMTAPPPAVFDAFEFAQGQIIEATCGDAAGCVVLTRQVLDALLTKAAQSGRASCRRTDI